MDEPIAQAASQVLQKISKADTKMNIIYNTVPQGVYSSIHESDRQLDVGLCGSESEGLEKKHGTANYAEVRSNRRVLEVVSREQPLNHSA